MIKPQLSIIIVNFNTRKLLSDCIESIYQTTKKVNFEIIVIDNNSQDDSISHLAKNYPQVKLIQNKNNLGFGKANNQGAKIAKGDFLLFLNSDTILNPDCLDYFFSDLKLDKNTIYAAKLLNKDNSIQPSAGFSPTINRIKNQMLFLDDLPFFANSQKYQQSNPDFYTKNQEVEWVTGAFILMPRNLFIKINGFDESIFMYGEEVDLCFRAIKAGASVKFLTAPSLCHLKGASSQNGFEKSVIGEFKGLITFYKKHFPDKIKLLKFYLKIGALLRIALFAIIDFNKSKTYYKALKVI